MPRFVGYSVSTGARTDREHDIVTCAVEHIQRVCLLYPDCYELKYHIDVFKDIEELFYITLTSNRKNIVGKDSRAVGISNSQPVLTTAEAREIVSRTRFISECSGVWQVEIKSATHCGTLVEATAGDEDENLDDLEQTRHPIPPMDVEMSLNKERKIIEDRLERDYKAIEEVKTLHAMKEPKWAKWWR